MVAHAEQDDGKLVVKPGDPDWVTFPGLPQCEKQFNSVG